MVLFKSKMAAVAMASVTELNKALPQKAARKWCEQSMSCGARRVTWKFKMKKNRNPS